MAAKISSEETHSVVSSSAPAARNTVLSNMCPRKRSSDFVTNGDSDAFEDETCDIQSRKRQHKIRWTRDEEAELRRLHQGFESHRNKWSLVAQALDTGRTAAQCAQHWHRVMNPEVRKGAFTIQEQKLLLASVKTHGEQWAVIARAMGSRSEAQCRSWYKKLRCQAKPDHSRTPTALIEHAMPPSSVIISLPKLPAINKLQPSEHQQLAVTSMSSGIHFPPGTYLPNEGPLQPQLGHTPVKPRLPSLKTMLAPSRNS
jgi:hypothetical protein